MNTGTDISRDTETALSGVPNALTLEAVKELDEGRGVRFDSVEDLFGDLDI